MRFPSVVDCTPRVIHGNQHMEDIHYINAGFPYTVTESFMDLFEGLTYAQADATFAEALHEQGNTYWSMYINPYKYGFSGSSAGSYYDYSHTYEVNDYTQRLDEARRASENSAVSNNLNSAWQSRFGNEFSYANRNFGSEELLLSGDLTCHSSFDLICIFKLAFPASLVSYPHVNTLMSLCTYFAAFTSPLTVLTMSSIVLIPPPLSPGSSPKTKRSMTLHGMVLMSSHL
ncbi:hypothetical protein ZIOFF_055058 [Zingiber officinale]|uniref:Uncharacterized protein n=1 Tax=Zingiber officinale TaxID=94328 RepID=A0A8J5KE92_ZINOF|nr:hypothetical protein ZIOFF_055058 [Zingiber officinale]